MCVTQVFLDGAAGLLLISNQSRWIKAGETEALGPIAAERGAVASLWCCAVLISVQ